MENYESLLKDYNHEKAKACEILSKAHKRTFDLLQKNVDKLSAEIFRYVQEDLKNLKDAFPSYRFILMPLTRTKGNDIGPDYGVDIESAWIIFGVLRQSVDIQASEQINSILEIYFEAGCSADYYEWDDNLNAKFKSLNLEIITDQLPPLNYTEVITGHRRFKT